MELRSDETTPKEAQRLEFCQDQKNEPEVKKKPDMRNVSDKTDEPIIIKEWARPEMRNEPGKKDEPRKIKKGDRYRESMKSKNWAKGGEEPEGLFYWQKYVWSADEKRGGTIECEPC